MCSFVCAEVESAYESKSEEYIGDHARRYSEGAYEVRSKRVALVGAWSQGVTQALSSHKNKIRNLIFGGLQKSQGVSKSLRETQNSIQR